MKKLIAVLFTLVLGFAMIGCAADSGDNYVPDMGGKDEGVQTETSNNVVVDGNRKVIYEVSYSIHGEDALDIKNQVNNKVIEIEGYTSSSKDTTSSAEVVYKIPTDKLNAFLDYIDSFDGIGSKQITSSDITSSYAYTEAKIQTLMASREAYVKILETENLTRTEIMQINDKIASIDTELLQISNEKASYDNKLNYSKVTINYYVSEKAPKQPTFFEEYAEYLVDFFVGLGKIILYSLPILLIAGGIFSSIFFPIHIKKRKARKQG